MHTQAVQYRKGTGSQMSSISLHGAAKLPSYGGVKGLRLPVRIEHAKGQWPRRAHCKLSWNGAGHLPALDPRKILPSSNLALIIVGAPSHIEAAVPLKPASPLLVRRGGSCMHLETCKQCGQCSTPDSATAEVNHEATQC